MLLLCFGICPSRHMLVRYFELVQMSAGCCFVACVSNLKEILLMLVLCGGFVPFETEVGSSYC